MLQACKLALLTCSIGLSGAPCVAAPETVISLSMGSTAWNDTASRFLFEKFVGENDLLKIQSDIHKSNGIFSYNTGGRSNVIISDALTVSALFGWPYTSDSLSTSLAFDYTNLSFPQGVSIFKDSAQFTQYTIRQQLIYGPINFSNKIGAFNLQLKPNLIAELRTSNSKYESALIKVEDTELDARILVALSIGISREKSPFYFTLNHQIDHFKNTQFSLGLHLIH